MKARVEIEFKDAEEAKNALKALEQETEFKKRSESSIETKGKSLIVEVSAEDVVALRATLNSYLRLVQVIRGIKGD